MIWVVRPFIFGDRVQKVVSEKYKRTARDLFGIFSRLMTENGHVVKETIHPVFHPNNLEQMYKFGMAKTDIIDMFDFCIKNWEALKKIPKLKGLSDEPNFDQMLSQFKYPTLYNACRSGIDSMLGSSVKKPVPEKNDAPGAPSEWLKKKITI